MARQAARPSRSRRSAPTGEDRTSRERGAGSRHERLAIAELRAYLAEPRSATRPSPAEVGALGPEAFNALIHEDEAAASILAMLHAPGLALGRHVLIDPSLAGEERLTVLLHELRHVEQTGAREPDLDGPLRLGSGADRLERDAATADAPSREPTGAAAPDVIRLNGMAHVLIRRMAEQQRRRRAHERWDESHEETFEAALRRQPRSIEQDIEATNMQILGARAEAVAMLAERGRVPPAMTENVRSVANAVIIIEALIAAKHPTGTGDFNASEPVDDAERNVLSPDDTESAKAAFNSFYVSAIGIASEEDRTQLQIWQLFQDTRETYDSAPRPPTITCPTNSCHTAPTTAEAFDFEAFSTRYHMPRPDPKAPGLSEKSARIEPATTIEQWRAVLADYREASETLDRLLLSRLGSSEEAEELSAQFRFLLDQRDKQEAFREEHPLAVRIPAVLFPSDQVATRDDEPGEVPVAEGIPWQFHLEVVGDEWRLHDLSRPNRKAPFAQPLSAEDRRRLDAGEVVDPPTALFSQLDHPELFPEGYLDVMLPSGATFSEPITHPWSLSDWLKAAGLTLAALAIIVGTGGTATALVGAAALGIGSAALSVAGTLTELRERERLGLLTQDDIDNAYFSIGLDVIGALALGLGSAVRLGSTSGRALSQLGVRSRNAILVLQRAQPVLQQANRVAQAADVGGALVNAYIVGSELVTAYGALQDQRGEMSEADYQRALARLTMTALVTGTLTTLQVRGGLDDAAQGGARRLADPGPDGSYRLADEGAEAAARQADEAPTGRSEAEGPEPPSALRRPDADVPGVGDDVGWSPAGTAPEPMHDPSLQAEAVVDIRWGEDGLPAEVRLRYRTPRPLVGTLMDPIALHQSLIVQFTGIRGKIRRLLSRLRAIFTGREIPMHLQMELWKHRRAAADTMATLRSGELANDLEVALMRRRLANIEDELQRLEARIDDPLLQFEPLDTDMVATRVVPENFPDPPTGYHYNLKRGGTAWELVPDSGVGPRLDVELGADGLPTGRRSNESRVEASGILGQNLDNPEVRARLRELGYAIDSRGRISRPQGHVELGEMVPLTTGPDGAVRVSEYQSVADLQAELRGRLTPDQEARLMAIEMFETAPGTRTVLVDGVFDTGTSWQAVLNPAAQRRLRARLRATGMPDAEINRLIRNLRAETSNITVVLGTSKGLRQSHNYRAGETGGGTTAQPGAPRHHGNPLYLGGSHNRELMFDLTEDQHNAIHRFFEQDLVFPPNTPLAGQRLDPNTMRSVATGQARPAVLLVDADGNVTPRLLDAGPTAETSQ